MASKRATRRSDVPLVCRRCMDSGIWSYSAGEGQCDCETGKKLAAWLAEDKSRSPYDYEADAYVYETVFKHAARFKPPVAGENLEAGDPVYLAKDGKYYRSKFPNLKNTEIA